MSKAPHQAGTDHAGHIAALNSSTDGARQAAAVAADLSTYLRYFGLHEAPFTITPDPRYLFLSRRHQEGLAHLLFGVGQGGSGGFVQLTGEVGTGKTTLCRCLLEQIPERTQIALILNPVLTPVELLSTLCDELGLEYPAGASSKQLMDLLTDYLLDSHAQGERVVVVIDEAQNLSRDALEQVRLLTNLETATDKLLQIVLLGQPELRQLLGREELRQLAQRITARYHLEPMDAEETAAYVRHRLAVAGAVRCPLTRGALRAIYHHSQGVPRLINIIADRALMGAYARDHHQVNAAMVRTAAREIRGERPSESWPSRVQFWAGAAVVLVLMVALVLWLSPEHVVKTSPETAVNSTAQTATETDMPQAQVAAAGVNPAAAQTIAGPTPNAAQAEDIGRIQALLAAGEAQAMWQLYARLWRSPEVDLQLACADGRSGSFLCLRQSGNWQRLARLGMPVVLIVPPQPPSDPNQATQGTEQELLLLGLRDDALLVHNGARSMQLSRAQFEQIWLGEYWVVAPGRNGSLSSQDTGSEVQRLKSLAAALQAMPYQGPVDRRFDPSLENWVRAFQRQHGLHADGIVGPATRLYLAAAVFTEPKLVEEW